MYANSYEPIDSAHLLVFDFFSTVPLYIGMPE